MNLIYLHSHDTGRYVQPYGHAIPTPHMQRLAEQGVMFRQAFCANPTCSPSRACLLSGMWAHNNGMTGLAHRGWQMNHYERHLANVLKANGYTCCLAGLQHVVNQRNGGPQICGYDHQPTLEDGDESPADVAVRWLRQHVQSNPGKPFFLDCGHSHTHRKGDHFHDPPPGEPKTDPRFVRPPAPLPDNATTRQDMADYIDDARSLDRFHGRVLDAVDELGIADHTLIVCTTDHGIAFPEMKCSLTDHGLGVLLLMRGPGGFSGGKVVDAMVSHLDVFPTFCDVLGIERPDWLQGESMLPLVSGEADAIRHEVFAEVNYHAAYEPKRCVRTQRYKYIRRFDGRDRRVLPNCDQSPSKTLLIDQGWAEQPVAEQSLFDLMLDPNETHDLADDPAHADALADMRRRLDRWMKDTNDPILNGPVPLPDGAVVNDPDGVSPQETPGTFHPSR